MTDSVTKPNYLHQYICIRNVLNYTVNTYETLVIYTEFDIIVGRMMQVPTAKYINFNGYLDVFK